MRMYLLDVFLNTSGDAAVNPASFTYFFFMSCAHHCCHLLKLPIRCCIVRSLRSRGGCCLRFLSLVFNLVISLRVCACLGCLFIIRVCMYVCRSSEENLLKNMELFDKLALCFQGRVIFIKDVAGQDICTWHFYGAKTKQAEVSVTASTVVECRFYVHVCVCGGGGGGYVLCVCVCVWVRASACVNQHNTI